MLEILRNLQQSAPVKFSLVAVNLDQKQPGFPEHILPEYLDKLGVEYKIVEENTYGIVYRRGDDPAQFWWRPAPSRSGTECHDADESRESRWAYPAGISR